MRKDEAIDKARKIRALAERGVEGEQANARALLDAFMAREGLTFADLDAAPPDTLDEYLDKLRRQAVERDQAWEQSGSDPNAFNTYRPGPDAPPRRFYANVYVASALRAYAVTNRWLGRTPDPDEVASFLRQVHTVANTLFP